MSDLKESSGPSLRTFSAKKLGFFRGAFKSNFKESIEKELYLEEDDPVASGKIIDWVLNVGIYCRVAHSPTERIDSSHELEWMKTYVLADKLGLDMLALECLTRYNYCLAFTNTCVSAEAVEFDYENTSSLSAARGMLTIMTTYYFLANCPYGAVGGFAAATSSNAEFNLAVTTQIWEHLKFGTCGLYFCQMHKHGRQM